MPRLFYSVISLSLLVFIALNPGKSNGQSDIFQYKAINVGGAQGCRVISFESNTLLYLNGIRLAQLPGSGEAFDFSCNSFDRLESRKPFYVMGRRGNHHIGWQSFKFSGSEFQISLTGGGPHSLHIYALRDTTVRVERNGSFFFSKSFEANSGYTISEINTDGMFEVTSGSGKILLFADSGTYDSPRVVPPKAKKLIGFSSRSSYLTSDGVSTVLVSSSDQEQYSVVVDETQEYAVGAGPSHFNGAAYALEVNDSNQISAYSEADGNGSASTPFMPLSMMSRRFILAGGTDWVAMASHRPTHIEEIHASTGKVLRVHKMTGSSKFNNIFQLNLKGNFEGRIFRGVRRNDRFHMWYQPNSRQTYQEEGDETVAFGWD